MYLATTLIGGLPHYNVKEAVDLSSLLDILCIPELKLRGDDIFSPLKKPGESSCLYEVKKRIIDKKIDITKIQGPGPVTAIKFGGYDGDIYFQNIYKHFEKVITALKDGNEKLKIMAFADEPSLFLVDFDFNYKVLHEDWLTLVKSLGADITGVHSCGDLTDKIELRRFDALFESEFDIISVDASKYDITRYPLFRNDKMIAWGIDFGKDIFGDELKFRNIDEVLEYLIKYARKGDLLTLPCGRDPKFYSADYVVREIENLLMIQSYLGQL